MRRSSPIRSPNVPREQPPRKSWLLRILFWSLAPLVLFRNLRGHRAGWIEEND